MTGSKMMINKRDCIHKVSTHRVLDNIKLVSSQVENLKNKCDKLCQTTYILVFQARSKTHAKF